MPRRCRAGSGGDEQHVGVTVVAAVGLDDLGAPGEAPRESQRTHGRFGAGVDQAHHAAAQRGHHRTDQLGELDLARRGRAEAQPVAGGLGHRLHHLGVGVTEQGGAPRADVVDERGAVLGDDVGAGRLAHEGGLAPDGRKGPDRTVHAPGNVFLGVVEQLAAAPRRAPVLELGGARAGRDGVTHPDRLRPGRRRRRRSRHLPRAKRRSSRRSAPRPGRRPRRRRCARGRRPTHRPAAG